MPARILEEQLGDVITPRRANTVAPIDIEVKRLISGNPALLEKAKRANSICVTLGSTSNNQRLGEFTKSLTDGLIEAGVPRHSVKILCTPDAINVDLSQLNGFEVRNHDSRTSDTVELAEYSGEFTPSINSILARADVKIIVGELKPHPLLGYAGLSDIVFPGLAGENSNEKHLTGRKGIDVADLRLERLDVARALGDLFVIGYVLDGDSSAANICLGTIDQCIPQLERTMRDLSVVQIQKPADIIVMSAGGAPSDETLRRAVETFPTGLAALRREGAMIVVAECGKGHGDTEFYKWSAERKEPRHLETRLRHRFNYHGLKAALLSRALQTRRIYLVSTVPDDYVKNVFGMRPAQTVNSALLAAQRAIGGDAIVSVIPDASRVVPQKPL